ncbi:glycosyltransferase [bacterium]|nr:glycosyltransferase [bacterium]
MRRMRVLQVLNNLDYGGAERYVQNLTDALDRQLAKSYLAYTVEGPMFEQMGQHVTLCKMSDHVLDFRHPVSSLLAMWRLWMFVRRNRIDLIHAHMFEVYFWVVLVGLVAGVPVVRTVHSVRSDYQPWAKPLEVLLARLASRTIVLTRSSRREILGFGVPGRRIAVIPNGITFPENRFQGRVGVGNKTNDRFVVGTVGRLAAHKNQAMLVRAAQQVVRDDPRVRFVIVGDGPLRSRLQQQAVDIGVSDYVTFAGWSDDVYAALTGFDLFVLTSSTECAPTVLIEAAAMGLPVVATAVGGIPEMVVHGKTGRLVKADDDGALAAEILALSQDPSSVIQMGRSGRERSSSIYVFPSIAKQIERVYQSCLPA